MARRSPVSPGSRAWTTDGSSRRPSARSKTSSCWSSTAPNGVCQVRSRSMCRIRVSTVSWQARRDEPIDPTMACRWKKTALLTVRCIPRPERFSRQHRKFGNARRKFEPSLSPMPASCPWRRDPMGPSRWARRTDSTCETAPRKTSVPSIRRTRSTPGIRAMSARWPLTRRGGSGSGVISAPASVMEMPGGSTREMKGCRTIISRARLRAKMELSGLARSAGPSVLTALVGRIAQDCAGCPTTMFSALPSNRMVRRGSPRVRGSATFAASP